MHTALHPKSIFHSLYSETDGYLISHKGRKKLDYFYQGHNYGEITYEGFLKMLALAKPKKNEIFYDLGSGTGKAVILASILGNFSKLTGIEIIEDLWQESNKILNHYQKKIVPHLLPQKKDQKISFLKNDFNKIDFSDADIIFLNSTHLKYEINPIFLRKLSQLKKGTKLLTNSQWIDFPLFSVSHIGRHLFTDGEEDVFIHYKK